MCWLILGLWKSKLLRYQGVQRFLQKQRVRRCPRDGLPTTRNGGFLETFYNQRLLFKRCTSHHFPIQPFCLFYQSVSWLFFLQKLGLLFSLGRYQCIPFAMRTASSKSTLAWLAAGFQPETHPIGSHFFFGFTSQVSQVSWVSLPKFYGFSVATWGCLEDECLLISKCHDFHLQHCWECLFGQRERAEYNVLVGNRNSGVALVSRKKQDNEKRSCLNDGKTGDGIWLSWSYASKCVAVVIVT